MNSRARFYGHRQATRYQATRVWDRLARIAVLVTLSAGTATGQLSYSIDSQGPTIGMVDASGTGPISGADILVPSPPVGPPPPPTIAIPAPALGIVPSPLGMTELDAHSYGYDDVIFRQQSPQFYYFSVDEFATGIPTPLPPNVFSEGALASGEAAADVFVFPPFAAPIPPPPIAPPPIGPVIGNTGVYDGNGGLTPFASPTLNLVEPNPPTPLTLMGPDPGDNLDSLDIDGAPSFPVYYSLDAAFADPLEVPPGLGGPPNTATAMANGFLGGDVLVSPVAGGPPVLYAAAPLLGLDLFGTGSDDLDALILNDMTDGAVGLYTPTTGPYSWMTGTDMLLFSVRRNSALVGTPDGLFGAPIEEGDILIPLGPGAVPGIWIAAEAMGLATVRSGFATSYGVPNLQYAGLDVWADDLDALDVSQQFVPEPVPLFQLAIGIVLLWFRTRRMSASY